MSTSSPLMAHRAAPREAGLVEASVKVYLLWNAETSRWDIDPLSVDGFPLDSDVCEFTDNGDKHTRADFARAAATDFPTGEGLAHMLIQAVADQGPRTDGSRQAALADQARTLAATMGGTEQVTTAAAMQAPAAPAVAKPQA